MNPEVLEMHKKDPVVLQKFKECVEIRKGDRFDLLMSNKDKDYYILNLGKTYNDIPVINIACSENDAYKKIIESIEEKKNNDEIEEKVPGVIKFLNSKKYGNENGSSQIVAKDISGNVCAFLQQIHSWAPVGGGIKVNVRLVVYENKKEFIVGDWNVRDQYDPTKDNENKLYNSIKILENNKEFVFVEVGTWKGAKDVYKRCKKSK